MNHRMLIVILTVAILMPGSVSAGREARLFPDSLPGRQWAAFPAEGFTVPVTGVIYRGGNMLPGMPLGGLGTGFISLGTDGTLDYAGTIFSNYMERRCLAVVDLVDHGAALENADGAATRTNVPVRRLPFLGISVEGKTTLLSLHPVEGVQEVRDISYWGHYPVADVQYDSDVPVSVALRAWTPFLPGDSVGSNTPGSVFEVQLHNTSSRMQKGTLAFSFSGPRKARQAHTYVARELNGRPGVKCISNGSDPRFQLPAQQKGVSGAAWGGDPAFTVFFLGTVYKAGASATHIVSWGAGGEAGLGTAIEVEATANRVNWVAGAGGSAMTNANTFKGHWGKPTIICVRKKPGPISDTTSIAIDGVDRPLASNSSSATPNMLPMPPFLGAHAPFRTPYMIVGEVVLYNRALTDDETNGIGCYLARKYGLDTAYRDSVKSISPDRLDGLDSWFKAESFAGLEDGVDISQQSCPSQTRRRFAGREFTGVTVKTFEEGFERSYALLVIGKENVRFGGELGEHAVTWNSIGSTLPKPSADDVGSSAAVDFSLEPGQSRTIRFVLAWCAPNWKSFHGNPYVNMYATRFKSPAAVAAYLAREHRSLLNRVLAWQEVVYGEKRLPGWLQDSLINVLGLLSQQSFIMKSPDPKHWWGKDGFFCVNESLISCVQQSCIANDEFGEWAVNLLFPELGLRKLRAYKHYQKRDTGQTPSVLGTGPSTEADRPWFGQQLAIDGQVYIHMVDRYRLSTGDDKVLDEWYPSVKAGLKFMFTRDEDGDGLPDVHAGGHYLDAWHMEGAAPHVSTYWLATLGIVERMAKMQRDTEFAQECRSWYRKGSRSLEERLWNEPVGSYFLYNDSVTGKKSDTVACDQLIGDLFANLHSLPRILPERRVIRVMSTLERLNYAATKYGIRLACRPDGSEDTTPGYATFMVPSYSTLAVATAMVRSNDPHFEALGLEIVRRTWHNIAIRQNMVWDQPAMVKVDGSRALGLEYYHNPMLWTFPISLMKQDIHTACSPGGFVWRIRAAASPAASRNR
ncbi:MAG: hypothetical protein HYX78_07635 [Armatimonadetes bacterium]|nr:hypothetical protein [Armatimonadota bacterium]